MPKKTRQVRDVLYYTIIKKICITAWNNCFVNKNRFSHLEPISSVDSVTFSTRGVCSPPIRLSLHV